jgi:RNA 2',3'-cyclic 3'-phosphodiesterase
VSLKAVAASGDVTGGLAYAWAMDENTPATASLFIGLWPDEAVRDALVRYRETWAWPPRASLAARERLHLTLHFLGDVPCERIPEFVQALQVPFEPFTLSLERPDVWGDGIAVLRPAAVPKPLRQLHERLHAVLRRMNQWTAITRLEPHVTLARKARGVVVPPRGEAIEWQVDHYALIESGLPPPDRYRIRATYC